MKKKKYAKAGSILWAVRKLWKLDKWNILLIVASVPPAVLLPLVSSYFSKELIDRIERGADFQKLLQIVVGFLVMLMALEVLQKRILAGREARNYYPTTVCQNEMDMYQNYVTDYENTEKQEFKQISGYAWQDAGMGNCSLDFLREDLVKLLTDLAGSFTYASFLVVLNPAIFAAAAVVAFLSYFTTRWQTIYQEKNKHQWEKETRKKDYLQKLSLDFARAKDIKLYGLDQWLEKMMQDYQTYILMWKKRCSFRGMWASILAGGMTFFQNTVVYLVLIEMLLDGKISVGEFVFYFGLVSSIAGFLQGIVGDVAKLGNRAEKIAYYREFFDYPNNFHHGKGCELPNSPVKIELRDVWYRYDGAEDYTLKGINLVINSGENLALVGMNGAGKTTLVKLITGMYRPTKGEILVGGRKIEEYNIEEYYSLISAVFQEIRPVAFTMFEFVASADLQRPNAREDAVAAMKAAGIYEKIAGLENGMDTHLMKGIYEDGVDLSGGEMQKLLLARAIYKDGSILILDEPTSALDPIAENNLYLKYQSLTQGKTSIYISHRFASTRFCDRIVLLENGVITESGSHEELMGKNGQYAYMFGVQSKYYKEGEVHE